MLKQTDRNGARLRRHLRVRGKVRGTAERPRLAVFRSITHTYAQVIDDTAGRTLAAASTVNLKTGKNDLAAAQAVGKDIAAKAVKAGVSKVVFDRGGYIYHGRVKALAEAAREAGLEF
jgi:large subunit ribosomal protein L18